MLDLVSQVRDVVLMNVYLDLGDPGGSGFWNGGVYEPGEGNGKLVHEQPGYEVDGSSQQGGFQVSKECTNGSKGEWRKARSKGINLNSCNLYSCT